MNRQTDPLTDPRLEKAKAAAHDACQCGCHSGADVGSWCGVCGDLHPAIDAYAEMAARVAELAMLEQVHQILNGREVEYGGAQDLHDLRKRLRAELAGGTQPTMCQQHGNHVLVGCPVCQEQHDRMITGQPSPAGGLAGGTKDGDASVTVAPEVVTLVEGFDSPRHTITQPSPAGGERCPACNGGYNGRTCTHPFHSQPRKP